MDQRTISLWMKSGIPKEMLVYILTLQTRARIELPPDTLICGNGFDANNRLIEKMIEIEARDKELNDDPQAKE